MRTTTYIYVPGLGDGYDGFRRFGLSLWSRRKGVQTALVPMHWGDTVETAEQKVARVTTAINSAPPDTDIVLVGESAGGSIALTAFIRQQVRVSRVVTVCGKNVGADQLGQSYVRRYKALYDAVVLSETNLQGLSAGMLKRIRAIYNPHDPVVPSACTIVPGADNQSLRSIGHITTIASVLLFRFGLVSKSTKL